MISQSRLRVLPGAALLLAVALLAFGVFGGRPALAAPAAAPLPPSTACTRTGSNAVVCNLWAVTGTLTLPGAVTVPAWGYTGSAGGSVQVPGPMLEAIAGDTVTVTLTNNLGAGRSTSLTFEGQPLIPDMTGIGNGLSKTYSFNVSGAGTFLYEAGPVANAQHQAAMGLYGALIVRPGGVPTQAFSAAATAFDDEALVVLSEIDPALNNLADPAGFDMRNYKAKYRLINGKAYPDTAPIAAAANDRVLLRYVNAGQEEHTMTLLGVAYQQFLSVAGEELPNYRNLLSELLLPGQSATALAVIPAGAPAGAHFALYDGNLLLHNNGAQGFGGMLTFVSIAAAPPGNDTLGPSAAGLALAPNPTTGAANVTLSASISDAASGGSNIAGAEFYIDSTGGTPHAMTATDSSFNSPTESVVGTITVAEMAALAPGTHTIYVRGQDAAGTANWGSFNFIVLNLDKAGPATRSIGLTPPVSAGNASVAISATGDDSATGGSNVTAAEYRINGGGAVAMTVNGVGPIVSLDAVIPTATMGGLAEGGHVLSVRSRDALGNWGAYTDAPLLVDKTGPVASNVVALPNPTNGTTGYNPIVPSLLVTVTLNDPLAGGGGGAQSTVARAEGFIDTVGAQGTGFGFTPLDGVFDSASEKAYAFIPLTQIRALSTGQHRIYARGKDAAGNWGATSSVILVVDKTSPTFSSITLTPNAILAGTASVTLAVNGSSDGLGGTGVAGGEYWLCPPTCASPAAGSGTAFTGLSASIPTGSLAAGAYTVNARIRDTAWNWSTGANGVRSATLTVVPDAIFSDGFESGVLPGNWSSRSTTTSTRLNATAAAALAGSFGLQAQGNNTNYVQYNFTPAAGTYDARFYFRPNGNTSSGKDILTALTSSTFGSTVFRVRYRLNAGTPQVQIQVGTGTGNAAWANINGGTASNVIEAVWQAAGSSGPNPGTLALYVNGVPVQTLNTTSTNSVGAIRLGSVTATGNATLMYFDAFASKRSASPLLGP